MDVLCVGECAKNYVYLPGERGPGHLDARCWFPFLILGLRKRYQLTSINHDDDGDLA